jgi:hypothetical protein
MKYIKRFNVLNEFNNFIFDDTNTPNVSLIEELEQPENLAFISLIMPHNYANDYLTFIPVEDSTFGFSNAGLSYSLDNGKTWTELAANGTTPTIAAGSKILWKNNTTLTPSLSNGIGKFSSSKNFDAQGNIMSLLFGDNFANQTSLENKRYAFYSLFKESKVHNAENLVLHATTLADSCCYYMFRDCTSLTSAPQLPATTLADYCYFNMFRGCTLLTSASKLPAMTLASSCYEGMFLDCTSLITAPELPATTLTNFCYSGMFNGCTSLTTVPTLSATTLASGCCRSMFSGCTLLTSVPVLHATMLTSSCYSYMFNGCTSLSYVKMLATDISAYNCLANWLSNVSASGTFVKAEGTEIPSGASGIPEGWTVEAV